jgi:glycerol-3-phosphate dehydrogenase (NAD(P)+)
MTTSTTRTPRTNVAVLGAGKLGAAVAALLGQAGHEVVVWARKPDAARAIAQAAPNAARIRTATTAAEAAKGAALVAFAVPAFALRAVARAAGEVVDGSQIALHASRGVDAEFKLPHQVIREETCLKKIGALGGPLYLDDAARGRPLVAIVASRFDEVHRALRGLVAHTHVRLHASHDVVGVEVAGAMSNVAQIAAGLAEGIGLGETDQGILLTRGLIEATRVGCALGAERSTFQGLAGVGDLIPRPVTSTKRHRSLGIEIGEGRDAAHASAAQADLEGLRTVKEARALAKNFELSLPLVEAVDDVLNAGKPAAAALERVLSLDLDLDVAA